MPIINVENLTKHYGSTKAVDDISFTVKKGELFGFLGINGAGKSTTINMLSTLLKPTKGTARICSCELGKNNNEIRKKIGIVYQHNSLDGILTVEENLMVRGMLYHKTKSTTKAQLTHVVDILSLGEIKTKKYKTLSGGQKRRCEIAAVLMHTPEILFLDEPTTGLDPATRKNVWQTIEDLRKKTGMTVFLTTHYMEEATSANRIVIIDNGKICAHGSPFELKEKYTKDVLKLYTTEKIDELLCRNDFKKTDFGYNVYLDCTLDAVEVIKRSAAHIKGFEVLGGSIDDVFLNATGKNLEEN